MGLERRGEIMYIRESYIDDLLRHKDHDYIKVVTGIRRCGKSTLLVQYQDRLQMLGVPKERIITLNFEDYENEAYKNPKELHKFILEQIDIENNYYIFLDEIQMVSEFEHVLASLNLRKNLDIYITGSNAYLLSGELATFLSGRYVELLVFPLSFKEFFDYLGGDSRKVFEEYINRGGFPYAVSIEDTKTFKDYIHGVMNTVIVKDIMGRKKITDSLLLESIAKFLFSNVGSLVNIKKISDYLISNNRKTTSPTVETYVKGLMEALTIYRVDRYDIWGKKYLQMNSKYYVADLAIRKAYLNQRRPDVGHGLENIVFIELKRRGYEVYVGSIQGLEVDFIAEKSDDKVYIQVSQSVMLDEVFERETRSLLKIDDHYPKLLLTLDEICGADHGILHINLIDWLIDDSNIVKTYQKADFVVKEAKTTTYNVDKEVERYKENAKLLLKEKLAEFEKATLEGDTWEATEAWKTIVGVQEFLKLKK